MCGHLNVGVGKKSHIIILPKIPNNLMRHFLRGVFDADGSITNPNKKSSPQCNYSSASVVIKSQIKQYCQDRNIDCYISDMMVHWWGDNANNFLHEIYHNCNFFLKRKFDLYVEWSSWVKYKGTKNFPTKIRDKSTYNLSGLPWYKKRHNNG